MLKAAPSGSTNRPALAYKWFALVRTPAEQWAVIMDAPDVGRIIRAPARRKRNDEQLMDRVSYSSIPYTAWSVGISGSTEGSGLKIGMWPSEISS